MNKQIKLISKSIFRSDVQEEVFFGSGKVEEKDSVLEINFKNEELVFMILATQAKTRLIYEKPYPNEFEFILNETTDINYQSIYGTMALMIDTKEIKRLEDRVILRYNLLQVKQIVSQQEIEIIFEGGGYNG